MVRSVFSEAFRLKMEAVCFSESFDNHIQVYAASKAVDQNTDFCSRENLKSEGF
jgi:hypothetical protein